MSELIGSTIGNFRIQELIGSGGMSHVYRGAHVHLERVAAIKIMHAQFSTDPSFQERFLREAVVASQLHHPNIVEVYDTGVVDGAYYIAMAHIEGQTLAQILQERLPPVEESIGYIRQVASALDHAHARGVIHRDVKPSNVMVRPDGVAVLLDFGIAKALEEAGSGDTTGLTLAGAIVGTPAYLAPEQAGDGAVTPSADIYSLGCVAYELLSGRSPFAGRGFRSMVNAHLNETPLPLDEVTDHLPPALGAVVARALAKEPEERYPTAGAFAAALSAALLPGAEAAPTQLTTAPPLATGGPAAGQGVETLPGVNSSDATAIPTGAGAGQRSGGRSWATLGVVAFAIVALTTSGLLLLGGDDESDPTPTPDDQAHVTTTSAAGETPQAVATETAAPEATATELNVVDTPASTLPATATATPEETSTPTIEPTVPLSTRLEGIDAKIAFQTNRDQNFEIYVMNPDGTDQTNITITPELDDLTPAWSPDGSRIAWSRGFSSDGDPSLNVSYEIWVMNADGADQLRLTDSPGVDINPSWSPDGSRILFDSERDGNKEIYVMDADGGNQRRLTDNIAVDERPSFSPDGSQIIFASNREGSFDIWVMNADGTDPRRLTSFPDGERFPSWSPDGSRIVFSVHFSQAAFSVFTMDSDGGNAAMLAGTTSVDASPSWSPDGQFIYFQSHRDANFNIFAIDANGGEPLRLTESPLADMLPVWSPIFGETAHVITDTRVRLDGN